NTRCDAWATSWSDYEFECAGVGSHKWTRND
ncbi:unnamed protein product, partial [marine sediment metagenome]